LVVSVLVGAVLVRLYWSLAILISAATLVALTRGNGFFDPVEARALIVTTGRGDSPSTIALNISKTVASGTLHATIHS
jgi:hypothetical protein